jgi:hypothetical protein
VIQSAKIKKYFKGCFVGIVTKSIRGTQSNREGSFSGNHVVEGIYADEDKYFIFLANSAGYVIDSIHKKDIVRIFIPQEEENINEVPLN